MARSRRQRKPSEQEEAPVNGGVAPELHDEADAPAEDPGDSHISAEDVSMSEEAREEFDRGLQETLYEEDDVSLEELIGAIGPLRRTRRHPLLPGIRMFTAMLDEARGGYAVDRLEQMADALGLDFDGLEREGILQVAMGAMDEAGVPDVEQGVRIALQTRMALEQQSTEESMAAVGVADSLTEEAEEHDAPGPDEA